MNNSIVRGMWKQIKDNIKKRWGKLTEDDLFVIEGDSQKLSEIIQAKYSKNKEEANQEVRAFVISVYPKSRYIK